MTNYDSLLQDIVDKSCLSMWEGCACGLPKKHEGVHECAARTCDCTWTDEQAEAWWIIFKEELKS